MSILSAAGMLQSLIVQLPVILVLLLGLFVVMGGEGKIRGVSGWFAGFFVSMLVITVLSFIWQYLFKMILEGVPLLKQGPWYAANAFVWSLLRASSFLLIVLGYKNLTRQKPA